MRPFKHPNSTTASPSTQLCADARQVVENPEQYAHRPLLRRLAWMTLMNERGYMIDQQRLAQMPIEVANTTALAAMPIGNKGLANVAHTINEAKKENLR